MCFLYTRQIFRTINNQIFSLQLEILYLFIFDKKNIKFKFQITDLSQI